MMFIKFSRATYCIGKTYLFFYFAVLQCMYYRWKLHFDNERKSDIQFLQNQWTGSSSKSIFKMTNANIANSQVLSDLVFTRDNSGHKVIYTHSTHSYHYMPETLEHRNIRCKAVKSNEEPEAVIDVVNDEIVSVFHFSKHR